jgi:hypothetical protein
MQLFIEEYTGTGFLLIGDGSIPILSVMLATYSTDRSVIYFSFLTDNIDHQSKKIFSINKIEPSA